MKEYMVVTNDVELAISEYAKTGWEILSVQWQEKIGQIASVLVVRERDDTGGKFARRNS